MLTFNYKNFCFPFETLDADGSAPLVFGIQEGFSAVLVSSGKCSLPWVETLMAPAGSFFIGKGKLTLQPLGSCHLIGCCIGGAAGQEMAAGISQPMALSGLSCPEAAGLMHQLLAALAAEHPRQASALSYNLLCEFAGADFSPTPLPELVSSAIAQIQNNYGEVYGVEELAEELGVTKSHLIRSFSSHVGLTPGQYLTSVRIEHAKRLLLHPELSLESVANLCGFSSSNYLCKVFKKETGKTPASWRKAHLGQAQPENLPESDLFLL